MSERDAFGPNLRRERLKKGVSLQSIARTTKISQDLLEGLEQNDFSRWPHGIFARAYVRSYALEIGTDADAVVNDFCKWFKNGDRRVDRLVRGQASIIGHKSSWSDDLAAGGVATDRRLSSTGGPQPNPLAMPARRRLVASIVDSLLVIAVGAALSALAPINLTTSAPHSLRSAAHRSRGRSRRISMGGILLFERVRGVRGPPMCSAGPNTESVR
jgi:transcriptional regulator with XRE-family HTH domain